ncbi:type II secretion system secretin GspD [Scandinavium lactucae]|uniref:Type II secretion system secretin GspD n=1 Tax=Scandinavium lactucae TaxID=3095028 RepID=A0ABU4QPE8_9ENTR|nr:MULTISPECIES: type II secretion system secretin GspD [unclassified Scandinavium]MDX6040019.1 type II secretion system secretin GspD [Scandinavium sp. V105_6]MDX6048586.1 type II secretion system secretin GspD [Scandinavium sp. V105_1]
MKLSRKYLAFILALQIITPTSPTYAAQYSANFKNADIREFIAAVSKNTGKTILVEPSVQGNISVRSYDNFNEEEYYQFFLSVLDIYGFSVVNLDNGLVKVVRSASLKTAPGEIKDTATPSVGDEFITRVVSLQNVPVRELAPLLRQMMDSGGIGNVVHYDPSNVLLITGKANVVNRILEVIKRVDVNGTQAREVLKLHYASAVDLAEVINNLVREESKESPTQILLPKIVADKRTNSLVISGSEKIRKKLKSLVSRLDVEQSTQGNTRVFYLKYAKAAKIVEVLTGVSEKIATDKKSSSQGSNREDVSINADEQTNSVVITADQSTMQELENVIARLDIRRAQVLVEAIIVEVQDGNGLNLGVQWSNSEVGGQQFTKSGLPIFDVAQGARQFKKSGSMGTDNPMASALSSFNGLATGFFEGDWSVLLTALSSNNKNDILATPSIVTLDNKEASFNVGQDVPVLSGSQTTSGDNVFNTVERKTVGTKLKVTPQINEGDAVLMEIEQEVSSVDTTSGTSSDLGPTFNTRTIQNAVLVKTGETVVLGGLLDDSSKEQVSKVPLLGDIPVIGQLFRYTSTDISKRNLMVFIRPTIIRDDEVYRSLSKDKYTRFRSLQKQRIDDSRSGLVGIDDEERPVLKEVDFDAPKTPAAPTNPAPQAASTPAAPRNPFRQ